jgi:L-rhamnose mutarotase
MNECISRRYFALDLKDDDSLIADYENWHRPNKVWPEVLESLRASGVREVELFRCGNRLVMVMEVTGEPRGADTLPSESTNPRVRAWEELMWQYQQALPFARPGEKWVPMRRLFSLSEAIRDGASGG